MTVGQVPALVLRLRELDREARTTTYPVWAGFVRAGNRELRKFDTKTGSVKLGQCSYDPKSWYAEFYGRTEHRGVHEVKCLAATAVGKLPALDALASVLARHNVQI